jgi:cytoskeletal protein CcmA (bactofilin family)
VKDSDKQSQNSQISSENAYPETPTVLGPTVDIQAEIKGSEDLVIKGKFQGNINIENNSLIIEKSAEVDAEIRARNITIRGKVKGNIHATGKVYIEREAQVFGDMSAARISIMEGAQYKGSMKMISHIQPQ